MPQNVLENGSFESGALAPWVATGVNDGGVTDLEAHRGTYSLEMQPFDGVSQDLAKAKKCKRLRFWAKCPDAIHVGIAIGTVYYTDGSSSTTTFTGELGSGDWNEVTLLLIKRKFVTRVTFGVGESSPIYIDNVALID